MDGYYASTLPFYSTTNSQLFLFDFERIKSLISKKHKKIAKTTNHESVEKRETNKKSCVAKLIGKERTVDEIKSIQKFGSLHHKNLTSIYAYQITPPIVYMEYCERWSLLDVMKTNSELLNSEVTWCKIAIGILKGLKYLHSNCYLHLNLHPSNVLLTSNLTVKLTDPSFSPFSTIYPIYKTMKNLNQNTFSKNIQYYPKEVFTNKPTHHSDIYMFAMVMLFLCSKNHPFNDTPIDLVMKKILNNKRPLIHLKSFYFEMVILESSNPNKFLRPPIVLLIEHFHVLKNLAITEEKNYHQTNVCSE